MFSIYNHPTIFLVFQDLEFHGVMRFFFQDAGAKVATKCIRVASTATAKEVVDVLVEKFHPDMRMLTMNDYNLYEVHVNGGKFEKKKNFMTSSFFGIYHHEMLILFYLFLNLGFNDYLAKNIYFLYCYYCHLFSLFPSLLHAILHLQSVKWLGQNVVNMIVKEFTCLNNS